MTDSSNIEKYQNAFMESFNIEKSMLNETIFSIYSHSRHPIKF